MTAWELVEVCGAAADRVEAEAEGSRVLCRPDASGLIDPDLLLLAYERARVSARVAGR